jgi:nucleolar protein 9
MPKKHKGRREEQKKRKREHDDDAASPKRHKNEDAPSVEDAAFHHDHAADVTQPEGGLTFYGMLDDDEQEYFKRADEMLELNQFDDPDARKLFLDSVYKEADGKELKIANSQSCSRLLERLIQLSSPEQLKGLFQKFSGQ